MLPMKLGKKPLGVSTTVSRRVHPCLPSHLLTHPHIPVFANAGIAEHPWLPTFNVSTAPERPITKPNTRTLDVNLTGQLYTAALALQVFERQGLNRHGFRGKLVMTASVYSFFPSIVMPMYAASKAAVVHFMRTAASMYAGKDVTVNCSKLVPQI